MGSALNSKNRPLRVNGYTLIEILVSLSIVALLFGLGYVSFRDFARRQALSGVAKVLKGDLRFAQELALSGQKPDDSACNSPNVLDSYGFDVSSTTSYRIVANCSGGSVENKSVNLGSDITLSSPSVNPIDFKAIGEGTNIPDGTSATLTLTQDSTGNQFSVTVGSGGEIQ